MVEPFAKVSLFSPYLFLDWTSAWLHAFEEGLCFCDSPLRTLVSSRKKIDDFVVGLSVSCVFQS